MTQLLVRNLSESVKAGLRRLARLHGHSMEEEARNILRSAVTAKAEKPGNNLGTRIASHFKKCGFKEGEIKELRGQWAQPATFED